MFKGGNNMKHELTFNELMMISYLNEKYDEELV
jgi:hypothetical protein